MLYVHIYIPMSYTQYSDLSRNTLMQHSHITVTYSMENFIKNLLYMQVQLVFFYFFLLFIK